MEQAKKALKSKVDGFVKTLTKRYSCYSLTKDSVLSKAELIKFVKECIHYHPSAFNVQTTRVVMLFGDNPRIIWQHVLGLMPKDYPKLLVDELSNCCDSYVTMLFFDDCDATKKASENYHMDIANFETWAVQSLAMLQVVLWNGFTYLGYGANIQHYNRQLDEFTKRQYDLPNHWKMIAQMNVGISSKKAPTRTRMPIDHILTIK